MLNAPGDIKYKTLPVIVRYYAVLIEYFPVIPNVLRKRPQRGTSLIAQMFTFVLTKDKGPLSDFFFLKEPVVRLAVLIIMMSLVKISVKEVK